MRKIIVAAKSLNHVIGKDNGLAWRLPADEAFFMARIQDGWLLSGRVSFVSAQGKTIFKDRKDVVVITRDRDFSAPCAKVAHTIEEGIALAAADGAERLYILGGAQIYRQTMDLADALLITEVQAWMEGDAFFPPIDPARWQAVWREDHRKDEQNPYNYAFIYYERRLV
jgi:dihydrofolate reductase